MDKVEKFQWLLQDEPGVPFLLSKHQLQIDEDYQRTVTEEKVLAFAANWSWLACGALLVAERSPGEFYVFDGGNRLEAAMRRSDIKELPCVVFKLNNKMAEAMAFYRVNCNRGSVNSYHKLRALLVAKDPVALDVVKLMHSTGFEPAARSGRANTVYCIGGFMREFRTNRGLLEKMWPLISKLHKDLPLHERTFAAFMYVAQYGNVDLSSRAWESRVLTIGVERIGVGIARAAALYAGGGKRVFGIGLIEILNKGLRTTQRVKLRDNEDKGNT